MPPFILINYLDEVCAEDEKWVHEEAMTHIREQWEGQDAAGFADWNIELKYDDENGWHLIVKPLDPKKKKTIDDFEKVRDGIDRRGYLPDSSGLSSNWYCFVHSAEND